MNYILSIFYLFVAITLRSGVSESWDVVVSLTTTPFRLGSLDQVFHALTKQTRPPDRIILNLPAVFSRTNETYPDDAHLPDFFSKYSNLKVNRCGKDYGPATKIIPTLKLETNPTTTIVTIDDDTIYYKWSIEYVSDHAYQLGGEWTATGRCGDKSFINPSMWANLPAAIQNYFPEGEGSLRDKLWERRKSMAQFPRGQPCCCLLSEGVSSNGYSRKVFDHKIKTGDGKTLGFVEYMEIALANKHCFVSDDWVISNFFVLADVYAVDLTGIVKTQHMDIGEAGTVSDHLKNQKTAQPYLDCMKYLESKKISALQHIDEKRRGR